MPEELVLIVITILAYAMFRQWMQYRRRLLIHTERLTAIDRGLPVPPLDAETPRGNGWNVQRILLLAGLVWISLGVTYLVVMSAFIAHPTPRMTEDIPEGVQWIGLAPLLIGVSHLVVFWLGKKREDDVHPRPPLGSRAGLPSQSMPPPPIERMEPRQTV